MNNRILNNGFQILIVLAFCIISVMLWQYIGIYENPKLRKFANIISYEKIDIVCYFLLSTFLVISFLFPFFKAENFKMKKTLAFSIPTFFCMFFLIFLALDYNIKGLFRLGYVGDDYGYLMNIFGMFLLSPILIFSVILFFVGKLRKRNIIFIYILQFLAVQFAYFKHGFIGVLNTPIFQTVVTEGYFLFWTILFWWIIGNYFKVQMTKSIQ